MTELVCELIISLDGFARGQRSPGYYGYFGSDIADWITTNTAVPHRMLIGRRTYEMLAGLPRVQARGVRWLSSALAALFVPLARAGALRSMPCPRYSCRVVRPVRLAPAPAP